MKIAVMGGAYVNSGDFLIERRSKELVETVTGACVDILKRNVSYDDKIDMQIGRSCQNIRGGWKGHSISEKALYKE